MTDQFTVMYKCRGNCKKTQSSIKVIYGGTLQNGLLERGLDKKIKHFIEQCVSCSLA